MNKIYKVVWSKAKHCYVVTSELAKRQTKGCGARSLRMATVSLGVAASLLCSGAVLPIFGESVAEAASSYKISGTVEKDGVTKSFTEANFISSYGGQNDYGYGNQFFESGEATNAQNYHATITSAPNWRMFVGAGIDVGTVSGNTVTVNGDSTNITQSVIGGYAIGSETKTDESLVTQNEVTINAGTYYNVYGATMGMYYAAPGKTTDNTVTINGGMVKGNVWGGDGDVSDNNKVYIKGGTVKPLNTGQAVSGGVGVKEAINNKVYISGGTVGTEKANATKGYTGDISGGSSWGGKVDGNQIFVTGGTVHGVLYGGKNSTESVRNDYSAVGGDSPVEHTTLTGTVSNNEVQISGGTVNGNVYGGMGAVSASGNTVTIKENAVLGKDVEVYGGTAMAKYSTTTYTWSEASGWGVNTSVDKVEYGDVTNNTVNIGNFINSSANDYIYVYGGKVGGNDDATSTKKVNVSNNTVTVDANNSTISYVYGGVIGGKANGNVKENKVEIKSGTVYGVFGGLTTVGDATGNSVSVIDGDVKFYYGGILGGSSENGDAIDNTVTISGGSLVNTAGVQIKGGEVYDAAHKATGNKVNISNGTIGSNEGSQYKNGFYVIAGDASTRGGNATDNAITISGGSFAGENTFEFYGGKTKNIFTSHSETGEVITATVAANKNTVEISGGTFSDNENVKIYGAYSSASSSAIFGTDSKVTLTATVDENKVKISGGTFSGNVDVYGGYGTASAGVYGSGEEAVTTLTTNGNTVEISGGTFSGNVNVYGGYGHADGTSESGGGTATSSSSADNNKVIISGGNVTGDVYGGYNGSDNVDSAATGNKVEITGGTLEFDKFVYGGYSKTGAAMGNEVSINAEGKGAGNVYGGYSENGTAGGTSADKGNKIILTNGTATRLRGGYSKNGSASYNTITMNGGTVRYEIYGGQASGSAEHNEVTITKGIFSPGTGNFFIFGGGGEGATSADNNIVTIQGGANSTGGVYVYGGKGKTSASNNTVTIQGEANLTGSVYVYGGEAITKAFSGSTITETLGAAANNTVNIEKAVTVKGLYGGYGDATTSTGNTLNLGVHSVQTEETSYFQTIALTNAVSWEDGGTVLSAKNFDFNDSIKATLDISDASNLAAATSGQMTLLASQTDNDLNALSLKYNGGTATLNATTTSVKVKDSASSDDDGSGVIVNVQSTHTVSLDSANSYKNVIYSVENQTKGMTFGEIAFVKGGTARNLANAFTFDSATVLDATNLTFTESNETIAKGDSMVLAAGAKGLAADTKVTKPDKTVSIKMEDKQKIKYGAVASGNITTVAGAVKYTVDSVTLNTVDLAGWTGTPSDVTKETKSWSVTDSTQVKTDGINVSGMNPGDSRTILTADSSVQFATKHLTGGNVWQGSGSITDTDTSGVKIAGTTTGGGVKVNENNASQLIYQQSKNDVTGVTLGSVKYDTTKAVRTFGVAYDLTKAGINATDFKLSNLDDVKASMKTGDTLVVVNAEEAIANAKGETLKGFTATPEPMTVDFKDEKVDGKELTFEGTHKDTLSLNDKKTQVVYKVGEKEVNKSITFTGEVAWNDSEAYYDAEKGKEKYQFATADIDATNLKVTGKTTKALKKGDAMTLISATGLKAGKVTQPTDAGSIDMNYSEKGITLAGKVAGEVKAADNAVKYEVTGVNVNKADIGSVAWQKDATLVDFSDKANNFAGVTTIGTNQFAVTYAKPEEVAAKQSMTLLKANDSLKAIVNEEKAKTYSIEPVAGVTIDAKLTGKLANSGNNVTFTATENKASALTFGKVEWTGSNPLIDHSKTLKNVSFNGATVDTSNIDFYKEMYIEADQTTTLVSDFGGTPKDIKGTTYKVGTAFDGEGSATMENGNLIFRTKTSAGVSEQTHKAVMGVEATMGLLASGVGHLDKVLDGFGNVSNAGSDGASVAASFGGGKDRYETNSHVNINSWSAAVGVGARKETKKGTLQYGIFGEYGKGNYTMHSDVGRSDGDAHYAGGGLMAKWTNKHDVYTEASFRLGRVSDSANDLLRDGAGNAYGYDIHATYYGAHIGLGKVFNYKGGKSLDVYGKFFYTKRDGAEFDAKQHYNLDSVNSSVLRIGARYGTTDKKWNWYGGLAYEYEFDGEAKGTVNGTEIRAASIKGSSVRGEFGMRMDATKDNPWRTDISIYGYGGKHRGFGGSVNVAYTF